MRNPLTRRTTNLPSPRFGVGTNPFAALQSEMDRMFEGFGRDFWGGSYPSVDVEEREENIHITAEVPGMSKDDIQLDIAPGGDALRLRGEKKQEETKTDKGYRSFERMYGTFQREIPLPTRVDANRVNATLDNGILTVDLGKADGENATRRIEVKSR